MITRATGALLLGLTLAAADAPAQNYTVFDIPGAVGAPKVVGISDASEVTGSYADSSGKTHGFVRRADGTVTSFDVRGALAGTYPTGINTTGTVVGYFWTKPYTAQGFIRAQDGAITVYDVPDSYYTQPTAINAAGDIAGYFTPVITPVAFPTGFLLTAAGVLTTFTTPDSSLAIYAMNDLDAVAGVADTAGFLATTPGPVSGFFAPLPAIGADETFPVALNDLGVAAGYAFDDACGGSEGEFCVELFKRSFVRAADGTITEFGMPDSSRHGTWATGINSAGTIVGYYYSGSSHLAQGFIRDSAGALSSFMVPGMTQTAPVAINSFGEIAGACADSTGGHGFIRTP